MKKKTIKILNIIDILIVVLLLVQYQKLFQFLKLIFITFKSLLFDFNQAVLQLDWYMIDAFLSVVLIIIYASSRLFILKKIRLLQKPSKAYHWLISALVFCLLFAPLISSHNPYIQHDLRISKLLAPFSTKKTIFFESKRSCFSNS